MIELIDGLPDWVVGLEAVGKVESADYEAIAAPAVKHEPDAGAELVHDRCECFCRVLAAF